MKVLCPSGSAGEGVDLSCEGLQSGIFAAYFLIENRQHFFFRSFWSDPIR